jgi:glycosyltransferase involved in cell wall biosynthesis
MNVLMLTPDYPPVYGGIGTHVCELAKQLSKENIAITVLIARMDRCIKETYIERNANGVRIIEFDIDYDSEMNTNVDMMMSSSYRWAYMNMKIIKIVLSIIHQNNFDFVHVHDYFHGLVVDAIKRIYSIPIIVTVHTQHDSRKLIDSIKRFVILNSEYTIAVSNAIKIVIKELITNYCDNKIVVIPNGVIVDQEFHFWDGKSKTICVCGRMVKNKGFDIAI